MLTWDFGLLQAKIKVKVDSRQPHSGMTCGDSGMTLSVLSFPHALPLRHSRRSLAGIHVDLGLRAAAGQGQGQGQGGFPITPLGNDVR